MISLLTKSDLADVAFIESECFGADAWNKSMLCGEFDCGSVFLGAKSGGKTVGYVCARLIFDEAHINNVAVLPEFRRKGLGTRLIKSLFDYGAKHGVTKFTLEVNPDNAAARSLYAKSGFKEKGVRKGYYHGSDALIMWFDAGEN